MNINLFENELLIKTESVSSILTNDEINQKYIDGEIRIITEQGRYPLEEVARMFSNKEKYNDLVDYQRGIVWSPASRSLLIESFIMNIPIPPVFLYEKKYSYYEILDGKQRIAAIVDFYSDKYALEGLEIWGELNGRRYSELPERIKEGLNRRYLSSIIMLKESEKDSFEVNKLKKMVFERLNSGGLKLYPQESRNAIFSGPFNDACKNLAENTIFRKIWGFNKKNSLYTQISLFGDEEQSLIDNLHMRDVELVLRFFAFRQLRNFDGSLNSYLDKYLNFANSYNDELINKLSTICLDTINLAYSLFDGEPFRMYEAVSEDNIKKSKKASRTLYDPLMQVLSQWLPKKEILVDKKSDVQKRYMELLISNPDNFYGKIQTKTTIENRIRLFNEMFLSLL